MGRRLALFYFMLVLYLLGLGSGVASVPPVRAHTPVAANGAIVHVYLPSLSKAGQNLADGPMLAGCPVFPSDNIWNTPVDTLPIHPNSAAYINTIGATRTLHPDFGSGQWPPGSGSPIGIPYTTVAAIRPR